MICDRCKEVGRPTINEAAVEKINDKTFWKALCMCCLQEIVPIYTKQGIDIASSYRFISRRGQQ